MTTEREMQAVVRAGYDQMAERYAAARRRHGTVGHLDRLLAKVPNPARVLDVGCGSGIPVASYLVARGHDVIGIDLSPRQIELARQNVTGAEFHVRDMRDLQPGEYSVDAVVSFYAIFHTPRETHQETIELLASFLEPGGHLLITMGAGEWEGRDDFHGAPMVWSHYDAATNRELIEAAGFDVLSDVIDHSGGERHQVVLARKRAVESG